MATPAPFLRRLHGVRLADVSMAEAVHHVRLRPPEMLDLSACVNQPGMGTEAEVARLLAFVGPTVAMRVAAGVCGARKDRATGELVVTLAIKDVHPAVYAHPLRMTAAQQREFPDAARVLTLAAVDAALCNGVDPGVLWDGRARRFELVPRLHARMSQPMLEAEIRDAPRWARHMASLHRSIGARPGAPCPRV